MKRPVLSVAWWRGSKDNHRGPAGESVWVQHGSPGWTVTFSDWAEMPEVSDAQLEATCSRLEEFLLLRGAGVKEATGEFSVEESMGVLTVVHQGDA